MGTRHGRKLFLLNKLEDQCQGLGFFLGWHGKGKGYNTQDGITVGYEQGGNGCDLETKFFDV